MKKAFVFLLALLMFFLTACGGGAGDEVTEPLNSPSTTAAPGNVTSAVTDAAHPVTSTLLPEPVVTDPVPAETNAPGIKYEIGSADQLLAFMNSPDLGGDYVLTADIILNDPINVSSWANTAPATVWKPVGSETAPFTGSFDGQGHSVAGLYVNVDRAAGFFGCLDGATVKNLIIGEGYIRAAGTAAGGISGFYNGTTEVSDCLNLAVVTAADYVGGIMGKH